MERVRIFFVADDDAFVEAVSQALAAEDVEVVFVKELAACHPSLVRDVGVLLCVDSPGSSSHAAALRELRKQRPALVTVLLGAESTVSGDTAHVLLPTSATLDELVAVARLRR